MISSELPEVLAIGDRILVMREGRLTAEFGYADASEESIMAAATGQHEVQAAMSGRPDRQSRAAGASRRAAGRTRGG